MEEGKAQMVCKYFEGRGSLAIDFEIPGGEPFLVAAQIAPVSVRL